MFEVATEKAQQHLFIAKLLRASPFVTKVMPELVLFLTLPMEGKSMIGRKALVIRFANHIFSAWSNQDM